MSEFLSSIIASSNDAIIGTTVTGVVTSWNLAAEKMYGYSEREIVGKPISVLARSQDADEIFELLEEIKKDGHPGHSVTIRKRKDGTDVYVSQNVSPIKNAEGFIIGASTITRDIAEIEQAEKLLRNSEERYRRLFESAQDAILILDAWTGNIIDANPFLMNLLGFTKEEILGKKLWEIGSFVDMSYCKTAFEELQQKEYIRYEDLPLKTKDGQLIQVEFVSNVYLVGHKKVIQCNIRDITDRKEAEKALHNSEIRYRRLFEAAQDGILILDSDTGQITDANPFLLEMLDYSYSEVIGKKLWEIGVCKDTSLSEANFAELQSKEYIRYENLPLETKKGKQKQVEFVSNVYLVDGKKAIQCNIRDITERKLLEEEIRQMQKLEGLGTLAGGIAHDFNNILGIILAYITNIKRFKDDVKKLDIATDTIMKTVQRGKELVRQILTFARKTETEFSPVDINELVMETMAMILETFPKVLTYTHNFGKDIPFIYADRSQLHQALLNLCVNARDAMPIGGVLTINTRMVSGIRLRNLHPDAPASSYVCIEVSDSGEGISEEIRKRIFEPFFTTKDKGKGVGLGLAVVFGVVQTHKGFIDVESELVKGTTFRLYLPTSQAVEPNSVEVEETTEEVSGGTETLLVVEDEENLRLPLLTVLVENGYTVLSASDGSAAVNIYEEHKNEIALVLTDLGLPKITGMEVCKQIKQLNPNARIIVATGFLDSGLKSEFLKAGVQNFLFKPYYFKKVLKVVRKMLDEEDVSKFKES